MTSWFISRRSTGWARPFLKQASSTFKLHFRTNTLASGERLDGTGQPWMGDWCWGSGDRSLSRQRRRDGRNSSDVGTVKGINQ